VHSGGFTVALQGLEEPVIATIIDAVLKALSYFHRNGNIHRDIKVQLPATARVPTCAALTRARLLQAGNILVDDHGNVKLADYGVATSGFGSFSAGAHQTFVGTPCWCVFSTRAIAGSSVADLATAGWLPR
jgi:serine/threonine-protein kinase OSR1/STK39